MRHKIKTSDSQVRKEIKGWNDGAERDVRATKAKREKRK